MLVAMAILRIPAGGLSKMSLWFTVGIREWRGTMRRSLAVIKRIDQCTCISIWPRLGTTVTE